MNPLKEHLEQLFAHLKWADQRVLEALKSAEILPGVIMGLYAHVLGAEHVWLSRLEGIPAELPVWPDLSFADCDRLVAENTSRFDALLAAASDGDLKRSVTYRNSAGDQFTSSVEDILTHVAMHGSYHRGQIAMGLRASNEVPASTDYIAFVRGAPAATRRN